MRGELLARLVVQQLGHFEMAHRQTDGAGDALDDEPEHEVRVAEGVVRLRVRPGAGVRVARGVLAVDLGPSQARTGKRDQPRTLGGGRKSVGGPDLRRRSELPRRRRGGPRGDVHPIA